MQQAADMSRVIAHLKALLNQPGHPQAIPQIRRQASRLCRYLPTSNAAPIVPDFQKAAWRVNS